MILWLDGAHGARENMARDLALLARAENGGGPVLRLYRFDPPGITLGYRQVAGREIDLERCRRDGVEWAVRPTGGRAIFHAQEWTYSLSSPLDDPRWGGSLARACGRMSQLLLAALRRLGVPASLAVPGDGRARRHEARPVPPGKATAPCFASTARYEITLDGGKLVGSAQRRTARALLQQGSILLGAGHLRLVDYLRLPAAARPEWRCRLAATAAGASPYLAHVELRALGEALRAELGDDLAQREAAEGLNLLPAPDALPILAGLGQDRSHEA